MDEIWRTPRFRLAKYVQAAKEGGKGDAAFQREHAKWRRKIAVMEILDLVLNDGYEPHA